MVYPKNKKPSNTWRLKERDVAKKFGSKRAYLSGGVRQYGDVEHDVLYIEIKYRKNWSIFTLFKSVKELAEKQKKTPLLVLAEKYGKDYLVVVRLSDIKKIANYII